MRTLTCPRCGQRLTVSPMAPRALTCPNCLARFENPYGAAPGAATSAAAIPMASLAPAPSPPRYQAYRLDHQVERDARVSAYSLIALAAILAVGAVLSFMLGGRDVMGPLLTLGVAICVGTAIYQLRHPQLNAPGSQLLGGFTAFSGGCAKVMLIIFGVLLLLFGGCALLIVAANAPRF